jgi:hypothetical protein
MSENEIFQVCQKKRFAEKIALNGFTVDGVEKFWQLKLPCS